jgi:enterochelin esterase-like enzyme
MQLKSGLLTLVVLAALVPCRPARAALGDDIEVAKLRTNRTERDCSATIASDCRVLRDYSADSIRARIASNVHAWQEGNDLTFATEMDAQSVEVSGGLQYPMSRIKGTNLWIVTLREKNLDSAIVSYIFVGSGPNVTMPARFKSSVWRGRYAPAERLSSKELHGKIVVDTLQSASEAAKRGVVVYVPPARGNDPIAGVVYVGDGGATNGLAPMVDTLITTGALPRIMLVGIPSAMPKPGDAPDQDYRAMEYLWDFENGNAHFLAHEKYFIDEVIPYAEKKFGAPSGRAKRAVWGISNSAGWAIDMGLRHPDVIGNVMAFSPGGRHGQIDSTIVLKPEVRFFVQGGTLESAFHKIALSWGDSLTAKGLKPRVREVVAGHDWSVWQETFPDALLWAFKE